MKLPSYMLSKAMYFSKIITDILQSFSFLKIATWYVCQDTKSVLTSLIALCKCQMTSNATEPFAKIALQLLQIVHT